MRLIPCGCGSPSCPAPKPIKMTIAQAIIVDYVLRLAPAL